MSRFIDLAGRTSATTMLERLSAAAGWRDDTENFVDPRTVGAHRVIVAIRGRSFAVSIRTPRARSFAPVCAGSVEDSDGGGCRVRARLRLSWMTRIFFTVWFGGLAFAVSKGYREGIAEASSLMSPAAEGWSSVLIALALVSPLVGGVIWYTRREFRADGAQKMLRDVVAKAAG